MISMIELLDLKSAYDIRIYCFISLIRFFDCEYVFQKAWVNPFSFFFARLRLPCHRMSAIHFDWRALLRRRLSLKILPAFPFSFSPPIKNLTVSTSPSATQSGIQFRFDIRIDLCRVSIFDKTTLQPAFVCGKTSNPITRQRHLRYEVTFLPWKSLDDDTFSPSLQPHDPKSTHFDTPARSLSSGNTCSRRNVAICQLPLS